MPWHFLTDGRRQSRPRQAYGYRMSTWVALDDWQVGTLAALARKSDARIQPASIAAGPALLSRVELGLQLRDARELHVEIVTQLLDLFGVLVEECAEASVGSTLQCERSFDSRQGRSSHEGSPGSFADAAAADLVRTVGYVAKRGL